MAVQAWELAEDAAFVAPPRLEIVPAPPRRGRPVGAALFVALLVGALGLPVIHTALETPARPLAWSYRPAPTAQVDALDPLAPVMGARRPTSARPAGGIVFVSCTNLWTALPDGSHAHKLLAFPGASSPVFSPDARTIAFLGPGEGGSALFMVAADGGGLTEIGRFTEGGVPVAARVTNLSWSDTGRKLAFALVDPSHDPALGGSTIWTFDLRTGEFERVADAPPSAGFLQGRLVYPERMDSVRGDTVSFRARNSNSYVTRRMSTPGDDVAFAAVPSTFSDSWSAPHGAVLLSRDSSGEMNLLVKRSSWRRGVQATHAAPSPYRFHPHARLSISQDGSRASADLLDPKGDRAVGIIDLDSGEWTVLDYAWSAGFTPAPSSDGPLAAQRVARLAGDVFHSWGRRGDNTAASVLLTGTDDDLLQGGRRGHIAGIPQKTDQGWSMPATMYARADRRYGFQRVRLDFDRGRKGVIEATLRSTSDIRPLQTIEDAKAFVAAVVDDEIAFKWPALPAGAKLNPQWPVDAYSWDGEGVATVHLVVPGEGGKPHRSVNLSYGDVSFSLGCGGENDPQEDPVGAELGLYDELGSGPNATRQVLWPATLDVRDSATYSVYGEMPRAELERIARSMSS